MKAAKSKCKTIRISVRVSYKIHTFDSSIDSTIVVQDALILCLCVRVSSNLLVDEQEQKLTLKNENQNVVKDFLRGRSISTFD